MTLAAQAQTAYTAAIRPTATPRATEHRVIAEITHRLSATEPRARDDFRAFVQALHDNQKLWTTLAAEVADPGNALPRDLRARIFYLAEFTHAQTAKVLRREASAAPLIEINTAILGGLTDGGAG